MSVWLDCAPSPSAAVATAGGASSLYSAESAAAVDPWLAVARSIETAAAAWCLPGAAAATAEQRATERLQLEAALAQLQAALAGGGRLAGAATSLADVAVLTSLLPLFQDVLGQDVQQQYPAIASWLQSCAAEPQFAAVLGA
jgi:glutathione S-transferase